MSLLPNLRPGGKHGVASTETRDPIGYLVAALSRLAQTDLLDRLGLRKQTEQAVFTVDPQRVQHRHEGRPHVLTGRAPEARPASARRRRRPAASST